MKICRRCSTNSEAFRKDKNAKDGFRNICKDCESKSQRSQQAAYQRYNDQLRNYYGIDLEDWARMYNTQNGRCASNPAHKLGFDRLTHVDHCHKTKKVRGLLCANCNRALGGVMDDIESLTLLVEYLKRTSTTAKALRAA